MTSVAKFNTWQTTAGTTRQAIINVYSAVSTTQQSISQGSTGENRGATWFDLNNMSITLTPVSASSRFLIYGKLCLGTTTTDNYNLHWRITRNGTAIGNGTNGSYTWAAHGQIRSFSDATPYHVPVNYLDSPATTSAITYKIQALETNYALNILFNRGQETGWQSADSSTFTIFEIQA